MFKEILLLGDELLSFLGGAVIIYSSLKAVYYLVKGIASDRLDMNAIRLDFGNGIILALEFMIGADIILSMAKPTYYDIGMLAALVIIRTFLSYFLGKELEELKTTNHRAKSCCD